MHFEKFVSESLLYISKSFFHNFFQKGLAQCISYIVESVLQMEATSNKTNKDKNGIPKEDGVQNHEC